MAVSLDTDVANQIDSGAIKVIALIKFELTGNGETPDKTVGYHNGGRDFTWSGQDYLPNRFLDADGLMAGLGNQISERKILFSGVPTDNADDAIASIENYDYINAPVTVTYLCGDPETEEVLGVLVTHFYEINGVEFETGATDENGQATISLTISLETLSRRYRDQTHVKRSVEDQNRHNSATDTAFEYVATSPDWPMEWGQR
ncbi:DUF2163 domain-containing protein [Hoeflea sp.]|uniref:DUF2163 domain-containing protein n=1 Tax=Hoeflea sp. TaxID=1940281 RepID=UPI003B51E150